MLPSREASSLLLWRSGSSNITDASSFSGDAGSGPGVVEGEGERKLERMDNRLIDCCGGSLASGLDDLSLSSVVKGLSMLIRLVGRLGVHRDKPTGGCCGLGAASVSAIVAD